jgi:D-alanyl-D-alanine carboxypeptidase/D-alanyl-D-alanine-endopeptidase (penicillin-binding protein 4)
MSVPDLTDGRASRTATMATMRLKAGLFALAAALAAASAPGAANAAGTPGGAALPGPDVPAQSSPTLARASASGTINRSKLRRRLKKLARRAPGASGFYVFDLDAGSRRVLFDRKQGKRRRLASNTKLFTTATALHRLGAEHRIATRVRMRGNLTGNGRLRGNLYLVGGGDPTLGSSGIRSLAKQIRRVGIKRVKGRLIADDTVFDRRRGVPDSGWGPSPYIAPLSGLVYGGSTYATDPALEAGAELKGKLRKRGVKVGGRVKLGRTPKKLRTRDPIAEVRSPTIAAIAEATNEPSNNFYAEMLLKRLWATPTRRGTTRGGARAVARFARSQGSRIDARDGSGLTDNNRASPRDVVRLLAAMREHRARGAFYESLPRAGKEGTLDDRMEGTAAAGRCRAKTGTITGVSALSGYCRAGRGKVAFSLLMNGVSSYDAARSIQDRMVVEIARYRP